MPFNLAIFGKDNADKILDNESYNYSKCYVGGHSLGGIMASSYAKEHEEKITGLILLASYSTEKLENISVLSICASEDKILNKENYNKAKENMPINFTEHVVEGGNHGQFGAYAHQSGDGIATISRDKQINEVSEEISSFIFSKK